LFQNLSYSGDETYPGEPDLMGKKPAQDYPMKLKDLLFPESSLNRIELRDPTLFALGNIESEHSHLTRLCLTIKMMKNLFR
jgi:hypothetical protein